MSGKKGRPKKAIRQEKNIGFFLTYAQYAVVQRKAELARVNISDYMRQVALQSEVRAKWTPEERELVKTLIGMSVELHGLMTVAEEEGVLAAAQQFQRCRDSIDEIVKKLCHDR